MTSRAEPGPRGQRTRERLLAAAEVELAECGRVEVTATARRAAVSVGLLYRYFAGKDALIAAVVERFHDRYESAVFGVASPPGTGWFEAERGRLEREVTFLLSDPAARWVIAAASQEPAVAHVDARRAHQQVALAARNIRHGQHRGEVDQVVDAELAAAGFLGALRATVTAALSDPAPGRGAPAVVEQVWRMGRAVIVPAG